MSLEFYLAKNHMTATEDDFMAVSRSPQNYTIEDVFDRMTRQGSSITKAEALAVFEEILQNIISMIKEGNTVSTPLVNIGSHVSGVFNGDDDSFDTERHSVRIGVSPGNRLRPVAPLIPVKKVAASERKPSPMHFYDISTKTQDERATQMGTARITGSLLKFDETDEEQGIWFIKTDGGADAKVGETVARNKPGELIFDVPETEPGEYKVEVRARLNGNTTIRTGTLNALITVT